MTSVSLTTTTCPSCAAVLYACMLAACGSKQHVDHAPAPRATAPWVEAGQCLPAEEEPAPCITVTAADAGAIRDAVLAYLDKPLDVPDIGEAKAMIERPIAQWTAAAYQLTPVRSSGGEEVVRLELSERTSSGVLSFSWNVARRGGVWTVDTRTDGEAAEAGPSAAVLAATPWIFRYNAPPRVETWTLRYAGTEAQLVVETAQGTQTYTGSATDSGTLALAVATKTAKLALDCKRDKRGVGASCKDKKPKAIDVLDCFHPDFKEPMTFAAAPGVEYAASCGGYQLLK